MRAVDKNTCNEEDALMPYCPTALSGLQSQSGIVTEARGRWELRFAWCIGHVAMEDGVDYPGQEDAGWEAENQASDEMGARSRSTGSTGEVKRGNGDRATDAET